MTSNFAYGVTGPLASWPVRITNINSHNCFRPIICGSVAHALARDFSLCVIVFRDPRGNPNSFVANMLGLLELSLQVLNSFNPAKYGALSFWAILLELSRFGKKGLY
jgi:hypothetical protein